MAAAPERVELKHRSIELAKNGFLQNGRFDLPNTTGLAGQTFGAYKLISQPGQGGMGSVRVAERSDGRFERRVAVKFLNLALIVLFKQVRQLFPQFGIVFGEGAQPRFAFVFRHSPMTPLLASVRSSDPVSKSVLDLIEKRRWVYCGPRACFDLRAISAKPCEVASDSS